MNFKIIPILFGFVLITGCSYFNISEEEMIKRSQNEDCWQDCAQKKYHQKPDRESDFLFNRKIEQLKK